MNPKHDSNKNRNRRRVKGRQRWQSTLGFAFYGSSVHSGGWWPSFSRVRKGCFVGAHWRQEHATIFIGTGPGSLKGGKGLGFSGHAGGQLGYGPQVGHSPEGYPIYLYTDPRSGLTTYVVVLPDGRAFYSDVHGGFHVNPTESNAPVAGAIVLGTAGFLLGGPAGAIIGAIFGAIAGNEASKKRAA